MTNRDEIEKSVDEMLAGWFNGERHDVDRNDIIEMVIKHSAATAVPVATVAVMGVSGVRVLIPHPPGSADHLPIGTKLYAAPPAPSVAVKALRDAAHDAAVALNAVLERPEDKDRQHHARQYLDALRSSLASTGGEQNDN